MRLTERLMEIGIWLFIFGMCVVIIGAILVSICALIDISKL